MNYSSRFFLYAPLALLLLIGVGFGVHWWFFVAALQKRLDAMQSHEAMPGVTVHYALRGVSGFPFNLDVVFGDFRVSVETGHGPAIWRAEHVALHALTYGRDETIFEAAGRQSLAWTDGRGKHRKLDFQTGATHASVIRSKGALSRFDLDLVAFGSLALTSSRIQLHLRYSGDRFDVAASSDDVHLSPLLHSAFGQDIKFLRLQGELTDAAAFDGLRAGASDWRSAVDSWRKASGAMRLEPIEINWGRLDMMGHGALSFDDAHRPQGIVDFKIAGMAAWLARNPPVRPNGIAAALRDRAAKAGSDQSGHLGAVLAIKDGIVYLGDEPAGMAKPLY